MKIIDFKNFIFLFFLYFLCNNCKSQVKDYFYPSLYLEQVYDYKSNYFIGADGKTYQNKIKVQYFYDYSTGYYKIYKKDGEEPLILTKNEFYEISDKSITLKYLFLEELNSSNNFNRIILKSPTAQWIDNTDPDVTDNYKSEFGKVITKSGTYSNCIIVTKTSKSKTGKVKWVENFKEKFYYAKNVGLIKHETYENNKLAESLSEELIDDFSLYSDSKILAEKIKVANEEKLKKEAEENFKKKEVEEKLKKKEAEEKLKIFLVNRKTSIYNYSLTNPSKYKIISDEIENKMIDEIKLLNDDSIWFKTNYSVLIDTNGVSKYSIVVINSSNKKLEELFEKHLDSLKLPKAHDIMFKDYSVNAKADFSIDIGLKRNSIKIFFLKNELKLKKGQHSFFNKHEKDLSDLIISKNFANGKYGININEMTKNNAQTYEIKINNFRGLGGPSNAFYSLIPGLGDKFVTGKYPILKTIGFFSSAGLGVYFKSRSRKNYDYYMNSISQTTMDKYYNKANVLNQIAWSLIGISTVYCIYDIIHVIKIGTYNKKQNQFTKKSLNL